MARAGFEFRPLMKRRRPVSHVDTSVRSNVRLTSAYVRRNIGGASSVAYVKSTGLPSSTGWEPLAGAAVAAGTSFRGAPSDGDEYVYVAEATNGVFWRFRYYATGGYWAFVGGPPL